MKFMSMIVGLLFVFAGLQRTTVSAQVTGSVLQAIQERGELICGVNPGLPGFSQEIDGDWVGFDVDLCRAIAAAILGDSNAVRFIPVDAADRSIVLATGEVDMLARNTTLTLSRDTEWRARFGPVVFYDGQGIMVRRESGINSLDLLAGGTICVETATTTELNMRETLEVRGLPYRLVNPNGDEIFTSEVSDLPQTTVRAFNSADEMLNTFFENRCDAVTADLSALAARRSRSDDPGSLSILDEILSKEPLAPLSLDSDPAFANVIMWTIFGLIEAEELGITSQNVTDFVDSEDTRIVRFLGTGSEVVGDNLGIPNNFMFNVISQVGNYGEIYSRHLGEETPLGLPRGLNQLWTEGGLLYSPPFR
ncbi:MAG: amino acid ABC transporter substrate-binding protein [Chloroflexi bacterium]|nr:MAG: amino acid ABC transporter substrate-binding protein [Chloroflexota bacterium]